MAALLAVAAILLTACSSGGSTPAPPGPQPTTSSPAPTPSVAPAAAKAVARAAAQTKALHEFSFAATTTVAANQPEHARLVGRLIEGRGIAYRLTVNHKRTQVIRVRRATYVRQVPGHWSKLAKPRAIAHPTSTLLALLHGMTATSVVRVGGGTRVDGALSPAVGRQVGIPTTTTPATAMVVIDRHNHVTAVTLRATTTAGGHQVRLSVVTHYRNFGHVPPITRP